MNQREVEIWLLYPSGDGSSSQIRNLIESECNAKGWRLQARKMGRISTREGRLVRPMRTEDATNLYRRIHRARVGVWQVGDAHVLIKPEPNPKARDYVRLSRFLEHKTLHTRISSKDFHNRWLPSLTEFISWLGYTECEGEGDPRCLPLHVFATKFPTNYLSTGEGRSEFAGVHGVQSSRVDDSHLHWNRPEGAFHGREVLQVAGRNLARGFHWDVSSRTTTRRITTTSEIWRISPNGYVTVYPDQYIRIGQRARRLLPGKKAKAR